MTKYIAFEYYPSYPKNEAYVFSIWQGYYEAQVCYYIYKYFEDLRGIDLFALGKQFWNSPSKCVYWGGGWDPSSLVGQRSLPGGLGKDS